MRMLDRIKCRELSAGRKPSSTTDSASFGAIVKRLPCQRRACLAWLELLLMVAIAILVLQVFPSFSRAILWSIDVRNWPRTVWFIANVGILLLLIFLRFGPQLMEDWRSRRNRLAAEALEKSRRQELREQRETLERLKQARRRRIY